MRRRPNSLKAMLRLGPVACRLLVLLLACLPGAAHAEGASAEEWAEGVDRLGSMGLFDRAAELAESAVQQYPDDASLWFLLGHARQLSGDPAAAVLAFRSGYAIRSDPVVADRLSEIYVQCGLNRAAALLLEEELETRPGNAKFHVRAGGIYRLEVANADALRHFRAATEAEPSSAEAWSELIDFLLATGDLEGASQELANCLEGLGEQHPAGWYWRGRIAFAARRTDESADWISRAVEAAPGLSEWRNSHADALMAAGRFEEARETLEQAISQDPASITLYHRLGTACRRVGDATGAREALLVFQLLRGDRTSGWATVPRDDPAFPHIQARLAENALEQEKYDLAARYARNALEMLPGMVDARVLLAAAYEAQGRPIQAIADLLTLQQARGASPAYQRTLARLYQAAGDSTEAARRIDLARKLESPDNGNTGAADIREASDASDENLEEPRPLRQVD